MGELSAPEAPSVEARADISEPLLASVMRAHRATEYDGRDFYRRIGGSLEIHCTVDSQRRAVTEAASVATRFRGYESLLLRRGLREAGLVSSGASGICGGVHATASSLCLEMALGVAPPALGILARNLLLSCQYLNDNPMHLFVLSGPDYSERVISRTNPEIWELAQRTRTHHGGVHGFATVGSIMRELNRGTGALFQEALRMAGRARAAYSVLGGKFPHSESFVCGGVTLSLSSDKLAAFEDKLAPFAEYAVRCARIWDDIFDFLYEANPAYAQVGAAPANMLDFGQWDHDEHYNAGYRDCDHWGAQRWSTPGAIVDGRLATTRLTELNRGLAEGTGRAFFRDVGGPQPHEQDPLGHALRGDHPWNKRVAACPLAQRSPQPYSWASAMTWRERTFEVGAYARLYLSALAGQTPKSEFLESTGRAMRFRVRGHRKGRARADLEWSVPVVWNAFERNRARAYAVAFNVAVTLENIRRARSLGLRDGVALRRPFDIPTRGRHFGAGFCGAGRGFLAHWAVIEDGAFSAYRIAVPSRINAGPRAPSGELGAIEKALQDSPILESTRKSEELVGIDITRTIQSFDPCMSCSAHIHLQGSDIHLERPVTTTGP